MADLKAVIKAADMCVSPAAAGEPVLLLSVSSSRVWSLESHAVLLLFVSSSRVGPLSLLVGLLLPLLLLLHRCTSE